MMAVMKFVAFLTILLRSSFFASGFIDPLDFLSLQMIRKALTDLPGSNFFDNWNFNIGDPCLFSGVYCAGNNVIQLQLGGPTGLKGWLDPAIGNFVALAELDVVPGSVYGALPESLSKLTNLTQLAITGNRISGEIPASLGQLRKLQRLDLRCNRLSGSIPMEVGALPALFSVVLSGNHLNGSVPIFVSQNLNNVDLTHNHLSGALPANAFPPSLQYLSLSQNRLTGRVHNILTRLNNLTFLDLGINQFTGDIPVNIFSLPITTLLLDGNQFSGRLPWPVSQVNITTVDLSHNSLYGQIPSTFAGVKNLYLNHNGFSGNVSDQLVAGLLSSNITVLYLQHNSLTGRIPEFRLDKLPTNVTFCLTANLKLQPSICRLKEHDKKRRRPTYLCDA